MIEQESERETDRQREGDKTNVMRDGVRLPQGAGSDVRERTGDVEYSESSERFGRVMNAKRNEALDWRSARRCTHLRAGPESGNTQVASAGSRSLAEFVTTRSPFEPWFSLG